MALSVVHLADRNLQAHTHTQLIQMLSNRKLLFTSHTYSIHIHTIFTLTASVCIYHVLLFQGLSETTIITTKKKMYMFVQIILDNRKVEKVSFRKSTVQTSKSSKRNSKSNLHCSQRIAVSLFISANSNISIRSNRNLTELVQVQSARIRANQTATIRQTHNGHRRKYGSRATVVPTIRGHRTIAVAAVQPNGHH